MLMALRNAELVEKLVVLNMPLDVNSKLPGPLGAAKNPILKAFTRKSSIDAGMFVASGGPYAVQWDDAQAYQEPFDTEAGKEAFFATMDQCDWKGLLAEVDAGFDQWQGESVVAWGTADRFLDLKNALMWLETKRTCMKTFVFKEKVGHFPQSDYPERVCELVEKFVAGESLVNTSTKRVGDSTQT